MIKSVIAIISQRSLRQRLQISTDMESSPTVHLNVDTGKTGACLDIPGPLPSKEELNSLRRVRDHFPISAYLIVIVELLERFTFNGISGLFQNYMELPRNAADHTGGLGLGQSKATALSYFMHFWCYFTPIPAALVADMWLGKYKTIVYSVIIYIFGNLTLFVSSLPASIQNGHAEGGLIAAMIIIGIGCGGVRANVSTLVADQYTNTHLYVKTLESGERVIVDPNVTISGIFMVFYWAINLGYLSVIATTELEKNVDFWAAYLLPFSSFFLTLVFLLMGRRLYIRLPAQGSPIPNAVKITFMALYNGFDKNGYSPNVVPGSNPETVVHIPLNKGQGHMRKLRQLFEKAFQSFTLDIARPSVREKLGLAPVPWNDNFVDQVYRALIACNVFLFYPIYWLVHGQVLNNFISQAGGMQSHGLPNDIMQNINPLTIIVFVPIMNYVLYPFLRKNGFPMYPMTRICIGFLLASISMAYAAIVQHIIYLSPPCYEQVRACPASNHGKIPNQVHIAIQIPAYFFIALSEIFASITGYEYAYTKAPSSMKSFIMSIFLFSTAIGSAFGIALSPLSKNPKIIWLYVGLSITSAVFGVLFWVFFGKYNLIEEYLNRIDGAKRECESCACGNLEEEQSLDESMSDIMYITQPHSCCDCCSLRFEISAITALETTASISKVEDQSNKS